MLFLLHHLIKLVQSHLFRVQFYHTFHHFGELAVDGTVNQIVHILLLLEHVVGVVLQVLIGHVVHAILSELGAGGFLGCFLDVGIFHLNIIIAHELFLDEVPGQFLHAQVVVLLHKLLALVFVVLQHDALQQSIGISQLSDFLLAVGTKVVDESEVAVDSKLSLHSLSNSFAELFLVLNDVLTEHLVEQFLVHVSLHITADFGNLEAEIGSDVLGLFAADLQQ